MQTTTITEHRDTPVDPAWPAIDVRTDHLRLRPLAPADAAALARVGAQATTDCEDRPPTTEAAARSYIDRALRQRQDGWRLPVTVEWFGLVWGPTSMSLRREWLIVGTVSLLWSPGADEPDIGATVLARSVATTDCLDETRRLLAAWAAEQAE